MNLGIQPSSKPKPWRVPHAIVANGLQGPHAGPEPGWDRTAQILPDVRNTDAEELRGSILQAPRQYEILSEAVEKGAIERSQAFAK